MNKIESFTGEYYFLSNFYPCNVYFEGLIYPSSEHAYVAAKTTDKELRLQISLIRTAGQVKKFGRKLTLRPDWELIKFDIMEKLLRKKFEDPVLRNKLLTTKDAELIEGNYWGDTIWGVCNGVGENNLGRLLMKLREEIKQEFNLPNWCEKV